MLWSVRRWPFLLLIVFGLMAIQAQTCQAKEISVKLVWKFGQAGWVEIQVREGSYQLVCDDKTINFPQDSTLQIGWGGWSPILRINQGDFQTLKGTRLEIKGEENGSLRVRTPDGKKAVYRGKLTMDWQRDHWQLMNQLDSEDYLKGVVPIEMSNSWAKYGLEALKAQAVAARTYLMKQTQHRETITDSPDIDQAYAGMNVEGEASAAVEATRGKILVDGQSGEPIEALYSAHSGGYSEDAKNVWGNSDIHNVAHPDPFSDEIGGAAGRWHFVVSAPQLGSAFGLGPIKKVKLDKFVSGRVKNVILTDSFGNSLSISGRKFVQAFYPFGQEIQANAFLGTLFKTYNFPTSEIEANFRGVPPLLGVLDYGRLRDSSERYPANSGPRLSKIVSSSLGVSPVPQPYGVFIFEGRGWGHGAGMSQWGAYHMAQLGYSYADILHFYYSNVSIATADGNGA
ncbi:SpoIID/LytB domain protein [Desulfosporosinus acidiphilus SJ4]|uniref:SpoIID/LytB domain protein n=1 Tax=Desulfosporosinus acidiphilus (strain DSM 22704 / JCM 16185 / SJ4) TaxID=646529 RepID=I4D9A0_DESAJ|nr:SpoIID/LytB domain-containing protein [Desulfosporosinus acidiphilus]AFM42374.1 SpoIID/LytB domain protein [Desulfosporosinus acidiphilus SJ4]